jgi:hypothetical protein
MPYFDLNLPVPADAQTAKSFVDTAIQRMSNRFLQFFTVSLFLLVCSSRL